MVSSVGGTAVSSVIAAVMKEATAAQDVEISVLKKGQDIEKANGESALKLIASAAAVKSSEGIDVHV